MEPTKSGKKDNSKRRFPGVGGRRHNPVNAKAKVAEAKERQEAWSALGPKAQLTALDTRLGKGNGAQRQRARLQALIDSLQKPTKKTKTEAVETPVTLAEELETGSGGRLKAKDRRAAEHAKRPGAGGHQA